MPLGDGKGPPDGTGPLTGRKRFADTCRGLIDPQTGKETTSRGRLIVMVIVGGLFFIGWLMSRSPNQKNG